MSKSQVSFSKREKEKKRFKKRKEKEKKKEERKANSSGGGLDNMIAFVDEYGVITDTPPDPSIVKEKVNADNIEVSVPKKEKEDPDQLLTGKVEFFNDSKGYGFIKESGSNEKYFFHVNGTLEEVAQDNRVEFRLENGLKGINAVDVRKWTKPEIPTKTPEQPEKAQPEKAQTEKAQPEKADNPEKPAELDNTENPDNSVSSDNSSIPDNTEKS